MRGVTASARTLAALITIGFAVWQSVAQPEPSPDPTSAQVGSALAAYRGLVSDLPSSGVIGFVPTTDNDAFNAANRTVAQYGLAPRLVLNPFDAQAQFAVTGVDASDALDRDPRLAGYELVAVRDRRIRIYKRRLS